MPLLGGELPTRRPQAAARSSLQLPDFKLDHDHDPGAVDPHDDFTCGRALRSSTFWLLLGTLCVASGFFSGTFLGETWVPLNTI